MQIPSHWQRIENIFTGVPGYNCFACSPDHPTGFRMQSYYDSQENVVVCPLDNLSHELSGFPRIVHGGYQMMLLDEIMFWSILHMGKRIVVTVNMDVNMSRTVRTGASILVKGRMTRSLRRVYYAEGWIEEEGEVLAKSTGKYVAPRGEDFVEYLGGPPKAGRFRGLLAE